MAFAKYEGIQSHALTMKEQLEWHSSYDRHKSPIGHNHETVSSCTASFVWCGVDSWGYLFNVFDVFAREWTGYQFDSTAVKDNAILSVENALAAHKGRADTRELTLRADNGPQYTSHAFKDSMKALELKLEHIAYKTPEQNGAIESFHKTLKKEYIWPSDFQNFQEADRAIGKAYIDYNKYRIHSALGYFTPYEFLELWFADDDHEKNEEKVLNVVA